MEISREQKYVLNCELIVNCDIIMLHIIFVRILMIHVFCAVCEKYLYMLKEYKTSLKKKLDIERKQFLQS